MEQFTMINKPRDLHISKCKAQFAEFQKTHKYIMRHVHKKTNRFYLDGNMSYPIKGEPLGTVIAFYDQFGVFRMGYSKVHPKDKYNRHIGIMRAIEDAWEREGKGVPRQLHEAWDKILVFALSEKGQKVLLNAQA
jgi:hypothetical protein